MGDLKTNLNSQQKEQLALFFRQLRNDLASGSFLHDKFYTDDRSKLAGNTHHYWLRLGLGPESDSVVNGLLPKGLSNSTAQTLLVQLNRKIFDRLPDEYSTLIKIPFSVPIGEVGGARERRIERTIELRLPTITPYAVFYHRVNRMLGSLDFVVASPNESETDLLLTRYSKRSIAKARRLFPEVWDEARGHYVLDSRGAQFAKKLVKQLVDRNLLSDTTKFADLGSGVGTNLFAVNCYSPAHATGIELHPEIFKLSKIASRRLEKLGVIDSSRLELKQGDVFDSQVADIAEFDLIYVYSSLGKSEIDIDQVVDRMKLNAVVIFNQLPIRNRDKVEPLESVAGLFAFRKTKA